VGRGDRDRAVGKAKYPEIPVGAAKTCHIIDKSSRPTVWPSKFTREVRRKLRKNHLESQPKE